MAWYDDPITVIAVAVVIIAAAGIVIYAMRRLGKNLSQRSLKKQLMIQALIIPLHRSKFQKAFKHPQLLTQKTSCECSI
jgi:hypothetical protein